jgi:phosphoribosylglycinamide formyltransferase-1
MNIAFLASYNGSSAKAITDACFEGDLRASPTLMISNNAGSAALKWAEDLGLKTACLNNKTHPNYEDLDAAIAQRLQDEKIKLVICSGYMKLIGPKTINAFQGRILNVHPALLPNHGGQGMYGRHIHEAVKASGDDKTGITIHIVDGEYDKGRIVAQKEIAVLPTDTVDDIENKVKAAEPDFYIETVEKILSGDIEL